MKERITLLSSRDSDMILAVSMIGTSMRISLKHFLVLLFWLCSGSVLAETTSDLILRGKPITLEYPTVPSDPVYLERSNYLRDLLILIFEHVGYPYTLKPVPIPPVPSSRSVMMMREGRYDVSWIHTNIERERVMRPIRLPIYRGLGGWRLLFIREGDSADFATITTIDDLKTRIAGQGHDWPDIDILRHNDLIVRTAISRDSVFKLLGHSRVDYFPRGINEVWDEAQLAISKGFVVEPHLVLRYPTAFYLFVNKEDEALAQLLEKGFEMAIADGSFRELFLSRMRETIERANLKSRTVIELENPLLTDKTPLDRKKLWFHTDELKSLNRL